jgi:hypothetical protein
MVMILAHIIVYSGRKIYLYGEVLTLGAIFIVKRQRGYGLFVRCYHSWRHGDRWYR